MIRLAGLAVLACVIHSGAPAAQAADPPPVELLHTPRQVSPGPAAAVWVYPVPPVFPYQRRNRWDVWQASGVDRQNHWRPRVAYTPYGAVYLFDGRPYPYPALHQRDFVPYVLGQ